MEYAADSRSTTGPRVTQINSDLDVTQKLSAPTCIFGKDNCKISIQGEGANEKLLITLPSDGKQNGTSEGHRPTTYDMRSIIESIQELNRRTATFNCNVSFNSALDKFDTVENACEMFACDQVEDGLPAAQPGKIDIESANGLYKIPLVATEHDNADIYTLNDGGNATNSITIGADNSEIKNLHDALSRFLDPPSPQLINLFRLTFFDKSSNRMNNVNLTNTRINILDSEDGYTIYLVVEGYGVFIVKYNTEAHLVIAEPNIYAMRIYRVQKSDILTGLVYLIAWKDTVNKYMCWSLYNDSFNVITLDGDITSDITYDENCTWDKYALTQRYTGNPSALTMDSGRNCVRSSEDFILPITADNVCNIYMDYIASIINSSKTCSLLNKQSAPAFTFKRSGEWTSITKLNENEHLSIVQLVSNGIMSAITMDNGAKISQILMQRLYTDNARGFLTVPIYVNGTSRTNYSYLEFKSVSSIKWFFMLNTTDKKIDLGGTHSTDKIEILTSESNVRPVADEFLYVYNPDKHAVDENTISDTYYLINNGGIYKYLCEYDTNTTNLSCTASVIRSFTSPYNFSFAFPTNGSREAIIVDKNNTTYLFKPTTNEVIIGGKIDISPVTLSNNGIIITKDNMAYFAIPTVNALY